VISRSISQSGLFALVAAWVVSSNSAAQERHEVQLTASDGVTVYGDLYLSDAAGAPVLVLLHQAGANARAEYGPLVPRLTEEGYTVLAVDQRAGGNRMGGTNRTADALEAGADPSYCDAYPDVMAAFERALELSGGESVVVWGSSYSGALAFRLAAERGDRVKGVLGFSPAAGEAMGECPSDRFTPDVRVPALMLRPASEAQIPSVALALEAFAGMGHQTYVAAPGVHGSSMLNSDRVDGDVEPTWQVVLAFLRSL
jgi:pimeloyl-ACP methyl ester carboxylesterase